MPLDASVIMPIRCRRCRHFFRRYDARRVDATGIINTGITRYVAAALMMIYCRATAEAALCDGARWRLLIIDTYAGARAA